MKRTVRKRKLKEFETEKAQVEAAIKATASPEALGNLRLRHLGLKEKMAALA